MGGSHKTTHHTVKQENPYDDQWIRSKFDRHAMEGAGFQNWMATRQSQIGREQQMRDQLMAATSQLAQQGAGQQANIANLQRQVGAGAQGLSGLQAQFQGMSTAQQQQMKDLYNLANKQGTGVYGVQTPQGMTFTKVSGGTGSGRGSLQTGSLNV